ncbi:MAG: multidrug ABC transporter substrate-binding protein, partial [Silvibacterium sp.]|nr:multidrug ABC transporter substrate-binding protein [Silvibacterium sp.]
MTWFHRFFHRDNLYGDLAEEMRAHLDEKTEQFMREGMSREEAVHAARRAFGNATRIEEQGREAWQWPRIESFVSDAKFALRQLRRSPGFALTAILTLALGIGAVTSVFSVVDSVLLKPFAFPEPDRLVVLRVTAREFNNVPFPDNYKQYLNWKANSRTLADAAIFENNNV